MGRPSPETKKPLRLAHMGQALARQDPVEAWQAAVRARLRQAQTDSLRPALQLNVSFGFVLFASAVGAPGGLAGAAEVFVIASSASLTHELARALLARMLGRSCRVSLSIVGGRTEISGPDLMRGAALGMAVIGSLVNALLAVAALLAARHVAAARSVHLLHLIFAAHSVWALAQVLPFVPFRAGQALARRLPARQRRWHAIASAFLTLNLAVWALRVSQAPAVLVVLGCAAFSALQAAREAYAELCDERSGARGSATEARALLLFGNSRRATALARSALHIARSSIRRRELWTTLAWAGIAQRDPFATHTALLNLPTDAIDVHLLASYLNSCNRVEEALTLLQDARLLGDRSAETSKLLIDLLFTRGDRAEARAIALSDAAALSLEDRRAIDAALG